MCADVLEPSGGEVVDNDDFIAPGQMRIDQVGADEASATRDQDSHRGPPALSDAATSAGTATGWRTAPAAGVS